MELLKDSRRVPTGDQGMADVGQDIEQHGVLEVFPAFHHVLDPESDKPAGVHVGMAAE